MLLVKARPLSFLLGSLPMFPLFLTLRSLFGAMGSDGGIRLVEVCVLGLGRIGLPLALLLAKANHKVVGVDVNPLMLRKIREN
jgi:threonine dehydrogenase-like Zn-dependent dehydrogenase